MLTSTCASRRSGVHFLNISISKSVPNLRCFVVFDFQMCCAPATACAFWTSQLPKMLREWCALHILTSKCASRHNASTSQLPKSGPNMRFCTFWLRNVLRTTTPSRRFSVSTLRSHKSLEQHSESRLFYLFATLSLFWLFPPLLFHVSILPEAWLF